MNKINKPIYFYRAIIFFSSLIAVGVLWQKPIIVSVFLTILFIEMNRTFQWRLIKTSLLSGLLGPIAEMVAIWFKAWSYSEPQVLGVTLWLFPLWGVAALFFIALSEILGESLQSRTSKDRK